MELVSHNAMDSANYIQTKIISDNQGFKAMADSWDRLLKRSGVSNIYLSHEWLFRWWQAFANEGDHELSIVCFIAKDDLIAVAPFYIQKKGGYQFNFRDTLRLLGQPDTADSMPVTEQIDIIADQRNTHQGLIYDAFYKLLSGKNKQWSHCVFRGLSPRSLLYKLYVNLTQTRHDCARVASSALSVELPSSFDDFLLEQSHSWRSTYRGHQRIMHITGNSEFRYMSKPDDIHSGLQSLSQIACAQLRKTPQGECPYDSDQFMHFHDEMCSFLSLQGNVEIATLTMEGRLLGAIYLYYSDDVIQVYQVASVQGDGIRFSPATILVSQIIKRAISQGMSRIEFRSDCLGLNQQKVCVNGSFSKLYDLEWYKNRRSAYMVKSARKLSRALQAGK